MKKTTKRLSAMAASAVIAACTLGYFPTFAADTEKIPVIITFDFSGEGITIAETEDGEIPEINDISTTTSTSVFIPDAELEREGYLFSCWTADGIRAYEPGDVFRVPDEIEHDPESTEPVEIVMTPVWIDEEDDEFHTVIYSAIVDGEERNLDNEIIPKQNLLKNRVVSTSMASIQRNDALQHGWTDGTNVFLSQNKFIMPDHDVTMVPVWGFYHTIRYYAGDNVSNMISESEASYNQPATYPRDLADESRFSRKGYTITGWECDVDGQIYPLGYYYMMPDSDVTMTAVWAPIRYQILFKANTGNKNDNLKVPGYTDEYIVAPEMNAARNGYTFTGWSYESKIYQPGDEMLVLGATPGLGISAEAVWVKDSEITTEPKVMYGDANVDGEVSVSDAVLILQNLSSPDQYGINGTNSNHLTELGAKNADCANVGDGLTTLDALAIQKYTLHLISELPDNE